MTQEIPQQNFFSEDTVSLKSDPTNIGVIKEAWHEIDNYPDETYAVITAAGTTQEALRTYQKTGQPPRHHHIISFVTPLESALLVHESQLILIDRAFSFGDVVKRYATDAMSGTVINHGMKLKMRHCFAEDEEVLEEAPAPPQTSIDSISSGSGSLDSKRTVSPSSPRRRKKPCIRSDERPDSWTVKGVPDEEVTLAVDWEESDYVIWKNSWLGIVEEVLDDVAIRLSNGSVVVPEDCSNIEIPCIEIPASIKAHDDEMDWIDEGNFGKPPSPTVAADRLAVGQQVTTLTQNIRRGTWISGSYDPSIRPIGIVIEVRTRSLSVNWICQNMMVSGRFVPLSRPPYIIEGGDFQHVRKFRRSCRGQNTPLTGPIVCAQLGLEVGDRVRFRDLDAAVKKYDGRSETQGGLGKGKVVKIPREQHLGYDVNTFMVEATQTWVEVLWQNLSKTVELATSLIPYHNLDEREIWPGDFVVRKSDDPESELSFKDVGVIQAVDAGERIAKIRWFEKPRLQVLGHWIIPGSTTGKLKEEEEEVSIYDVIAHQAVGLYLGDIVFVAPQKPSDGTEDASQGVSSDETEMRSVGDTLRTIRDQGLLAALADSLAHSRNPLADSLANSRNPQLQTVGQMISIPEDAEVTMNCVDAESLVERSVDWVGEVIDRGLDGLITVRLGGLDEVRDVRAPIERLFLVTVDEIPDVPMGGDEHLDDYIAEDVVSDSDGSSVTWTSESKIIQEEVIYEGGERLPDDGGDEAWSTDEGDAIDGDENKMDKSWNWMDDPKEEGQHSTDSKQECHLSNNVKEEKVSNSTSKHARVEQKNKDGDTGSSAQLAPMPISITSEGEKGPPPFSILDSSPPSDHAFISKTRALSAATLRRLTKEHKILSTSLPKGVVVRAWESRLDLLRVLIIGPMNTPYELAPFLFDFQITEGFPSVPPEAFFHSWTNGLGRINPNLYEDGKICLSLLGTWHAQDKCEGWTSESSLLQVIVSLVGLVLVREPYYNEAGYDIYIGTPEARVSSQHYSERAYILSRGFVKRVLTKPIVGLEDEIKWLYRSENEGLDLLKQVVESTRKIVSRSEARRATTVAEERKEGTGEEEIYMEASGKLVEEEIGTEGVGNISTGGLILLKRYLSALEDILQQENAT